MQREAQIDHLEKLVLERPDDRVLREDLLFLYFDPRFERDPRRFGHILWLVRNFSESSTARSPFAQLPTDAAPEDHAAVRAEWECHLRSYPENPLLARGAACFVAATEPDSAVLILEDFVSRHGEDADVWMELGRIHTDPSKRLRYLLKAASQGSTQPNLLVWIGAAAVDTRNYAKVEEVGTTLLESAANDRQHLGKHANWKKSGAELWEKATRVTGSRDDAAELVHGIGRYAHHKHWGHTFMGLVALERGNLEAAKEHLQESAQVGPDPRLSSYGPSFRLAEALCHRGEWETVATYLHACGEFWNPEAIQEMLDKVESREVPLFTGR